MASSIQFSSFGNCRKGDVRDILLQDHTNTQVIKPGETYIHIDNMYYMNTVRGNVTWQIVASGSCTVEFYFSILEKLDDKYNADINDKEEIEDKFWTKVDSWVLTKDTPKIDNVVIDVCRFLKVVVTNTSGEKITVSGMGAYS